MNTSHHMLIYGCAEPGDSQRVWNCGEMAAEVPGQESGPVCKEGAQIIYAWAMDAPDLELPAGAYAWHCRVYTSKPLHVHLEHMPLCTDINRDVYACVADFYGWLVTSNANCISNVLHRRGI